MIRRKLYLATVVLLALLVVTAQPVAAASVSWSTASDWDNATSESNVVHESTANTDYSDASQVRLGAPTSGRVAEPSLVGHWLLQEDSGTVANDFAGSNDGSINNLNLGQSGVFGTSSYGFDQGYVDTSKFNFPSQTGEFTVGGWVYHDSLRDFSSLINSGDSGEGTWFRIVISNSGKGYFQLRTDGNSNQIKVSDAVSTGEWNHLAMKGDGSTLTAYVNGEQVGSTAISNLGYDMTNSMYIGDAPNPFGGGERSHDGRISDVRLYDSALSDSQISELASPKGYIKSSKSFVSPVKPTITTQTNLNGQSINLEITGSPGSQASETQSISLDDGTNTYTVPWGSSHSEFRINGSLETSDLGKTPILQSVELAGTASGSNVLGTVTSSGSGVNGVVVDAINQSTGDVVSTGSTSSDGSYQLTVSDGDYDIQAYKTGYSDSSQTVTVSGSDVSGVDFSLSADAPTLNDASADPQDEFVGTGTTTLSIDVDDAQFGTLGSPGEEVTVEFFSGSGTSLGTDTLTSAGTASVSADTPGEWYATATDATGLTDTSATFQITAPPDILLYNESSDQLLSKDATFEIESLDSSFSASQTISGGTGTLPVPREERLHVTATANGYVDRDFLLTNYTRDYPIVMLPTADADTIRYEQCFDLVDNTGKFDATNSYAIIQTEVNSSSTNYKGMVSSGYFGSSNLHCAFLVDQKPYTLSVQNTDGDMHRFGEWIAQDNGQSYTLQIGSLDVIESDSSADEKGRYFASSVIEDANPPRLKTEYFDKSAKTDTFGWSIYLVNESGKDTLLKSDTVEGQFGEFSDSYVLNDSLADGNFRVEWQAFSNGTEIANGTNNQGSLEDIDIPLPDRWLNVLSVVFIVAMGGLLAPSQPRLSAVVMVLSATVLTMVGWVAIPAWALAPAAAAAIAWQVAGVSGRI